MLVFYTSGMRIFFCLLLLTGFVFAQDLPCKSLLESLPATRFNDLTSFEAKFTYQELNSTLRLRQIEDVTGGRTYFETLDDETGELVIARYEGDTGTVERNGQVEAAPSRKEMDILPFFDVFLSQQMFANAELLGCDGMQTLETPEGTLKGEAVTVTMDEQTGQLLFDKDGHIVGWSAGSEIGVFENEYRDDLLVKSSFRIYDMPGETEVDEEPNLKRTMSFELVNYNQPIDESLFGETLPCENLLEVFKNQPDFTSLETSTTYLQDPSQPSDYRVVDFVGKRVYWEVTVNGVKTIYRLVNGEVTGTIEANGEEETTEVPEGIRLSLEATFSSSASFRDLADKAVVLSCDGERSYSDTTGEIVRGQQITVADKTNLEGDNAKLLFDDSGEFIGNYVDRPEDSGDFLLVNSGRKKDDAGVTVEITNATYTQAGDTFKLLSKTTTKTLSYNQLVDETLFEP
jgi:hypothetical protein